MYKMKKWMIGCVFICCMLFLVGTISAVLLQQNSLKGYRNIVSTGEEKIIFNTRINGNIICFEPKIFDGEKIEACELVGEIGDQEEVCEDLKYFLPEAIYIQDKYGRIISEVSDTDGGYCMEVLGKYDYLKIGRESIIIIGDLAYGSTNVDVVQEVGYTHLNLTDPSLVAYYPFDKNSSPVVFDYSRNNNDGVENNGASWNTDGPPSNLNGSYDFIMASNQDLAIGDSSSLNITGNLTISLWRRATATAGVQILVMKGNVASQNYKWGSFGNNFFFSVGNFFPNYVFGTTAPLGAGSWEHLVVTVLNGNNVTFYFNGNLEESLPIGVGTVQSTAGNLHIGSNRFVQWWQNGKLDEVMIYNRTLFLNEINQIYNSQLLKFKPQGTQTWNHLDLSPTSEDNIADVNISLAQFPEYNTRIRFSINNGPLAELDVNGFYSGYEISGDVHDATFTLHLLAGSNYFFTPLVAGNITIITWKQNGSNVAYVYPNEDTNLIYQSDRNLTLRINCYDSENNYCNSGTDCYLTILNPTDNTKLVNHQKMIYDTTNFYYELSGNNVEIGEYKGNVICFGNTTAYSNFKYSLTPTGTIPSTAQGILYAFLLVVCFFILMLCVVGAIRIDGKNQIGWGGLLEVNYGKYAKIGLFFLGYLFLIFTFFLAWQVSTQFLFFAFASTIFRTVHLILWIAFPLIFTSFVIIALIQWLLDLKLDELATRNLKPR